jgi:hypothetical protein
LKNKFPIEVDVEAFKMGRGSALVTVSNNQKTIASQTISYDNGMFDYKHLSFEIEADQLGFQAYTISVKPMNGEFTLKNNSKTIYIEVLDARNKVMLLSNAPHPDVSALKSVLEKDENTQIEAKLISDWDRKLTDVDLIVWHEPGIGFQQDFLDFIQKSGKPIFYFIGPNTTNTVVQKLDIGLKIGSTNQFDEVLDAMTWQDKFELLKGSIKAVVDGDIQSLVCFGDPGSGRSSRPWRAGFAQAKRAGSLPQSGRGGSARRRLQRCVL